MAASLKESTMNNTDNYRREHLLQKAKKRRQKERELKHALLPFTAPHQAAPSKRSMEAHACEKAEGWWKIKLEHNVNIGYVTELCTYKWLKQ